MNVIDLLHNEKFSEVINFCEGLLVERLRLASLFAS